MMADCSRRRSVAFISMGSNLGDKMGNCRRGLEMLSGNSDIDIVETSRYYQTEPVDYEDQDWFVNAVVKVRTDLGPFALLKELLAIENALGRRRESVPRFGPRIIDLDLILYDGLRIETEELVVPHPRMHKRRFVLEPICDIEPELPHPVLGKTMRQLLELPAVYGQKLVRIGNE